MTRKELKQLIKEHKVKQVCSIPDIDMLKGISRGASIMYKYVDKERYIFVQWYWGLDTDNVITPKQIISESRAACLELMEKDVANMHANPDTVEAVHRLYNECTDIMNGNSHTLTTMEDKICAKYVRKACDYFIHDRRYHL